MKYVLLVLSLFCFSCGEAPLFSGDNSIRVNAPIDMVQIPGTDIGLILNSNVNLSAEKGSITVLDMVTQEVNLDQSIFFPSFASRIKVDSSQQLIYVGDRANDVVQVFEYDLGNGAVADFSFSPKIIAQNQSIPNAIKADEEPFDIELYTNASGQTDIIYTSINEGTLVFINLNTFAPLDLFLNDERFGLPLVGLTAFNLDANLLGIGASNIFMDPSNARLAYVASSRSNIIFVVDVLDQEVEHVINMTDQFSFAGLRDILIDTSEHMFFIHQANDSLNKVDISHITNNGVLQDESAPVWLEQVSLPGSPESMSLTPDGTQLWISLYDLNRIEVYDSQTLQRLRSIDLEGRGPARILMSSNSDLVYICQFLSDSVAVVDRTTYVQSSEIQ